jgi:O-antigen/teichoic acid export membrane protein
MKPGPDQPAETLDQRLTRNVSELLAELRVAQAGVQILFGFLLSVAFTGQFRDASGFEKSLHLTAVLLAVASTALLTAPAAWHRLLFRHGRREEILRAGNSVVIAGLVCLSAAIVTTVALIAKVVFGTLAMVLVAVFVAVLFGLLWYWIPSRLLRTPRK